MSRLFDHKTSVFTMPPESAFMPSLVKGLLKIQKELKIPANKITLFLPTGRAIRSFQDCVVEMAGGKPAVLPKLIALGDIKDGDLLFSSSRVPMDAMKLPPAIAAMRRKFLLYSLIRKKANKAAIGPLSGEQGLALAEELGLLLDQMNNEGIDAGALEALYPKELSKHWQNVLVFLEIIFKEWPGLLKNHGVMEPVIRRNRLIDITIKNWQNHPPEYPVLAAGSTGSIPATRRLLDAIAKLPKGAVILPGLDTEMAEDDWRALSESHPQFVMKQSIAAFSLSREEVLPWPQISAPGNAKAKDRLAFARQALCPAETTNMWHTLKFDPVAAAKSIDVVECPTLQAEAGVIALVLRSTLEEKGKQAALVTRDRKLARLVKAELGRWGITIDDSAGQPLRTTPAGTYFALLAEMVANQYSPVSLLSFLKHPFCEAGLDRQSLLATIRLLDRLVLRGVKPAPGLRTLATEVKRAKMESGKDEINALIEIIRGLTKPFEQALQKKTVQFGDILAAHREAAIAFSGTRDGQPKLWLGEDGEALEDLLDTLSEHAPDFGPLDPAEYPAILKQLLQDKTVRPKRASHRRLFIWGALESRLQDVDVMILGGLNEKSWPPEPADDPWMSREMRAGIGLPTSDRQAGQSANDFMMALGHQQVIMTRAEKIEGTPSTPSRWLQRMKAMLGGHFRIGEHHWLHWTLSLDTPDAFQTLEPPRPTPPLSARPRQLSVTKIETWMRDPYAIYARHILELEPLGGLEEDPSALEKGTILHKIFEDFMKEAGGNIQESDLDTLLKKGEGIFARNSFTKPAVKVFWQPRFEKVAAGFLDRQLDRQQALDVVANEVSGGWKFKTGTNSFTLKAKADRIDQIKADKTYVVIDYKTGAGKTEKEIRTGHSPQLPLEGVMIRHGAFKGLSKADVSGFEYWTIGNPAKPAEVKTPIKPGDIESTLDQAEAGLKALVEAFDQKETPYLATPNPDRPAYHEYDQLSRLKEWQNRASRSGGSDD